MRPELYPVDGSSRTRKAWVSCPCYEIADKNQPKTVSAVSWRNRRHAEDQVNPMMIDMNFKREDDEIIMKSQL